jgi:hypothetical protein
MKKTVSAKLFIDTYKKFNGDKKKIMYELEKLGCPIADSTYRSKKTRLSDYLSGKKNYEDKFNPMVDKSTLIRKPDENGEVLLEWQKTKYSAKDKLTAFQDAIIDLADDIKPLPVIEIPECSVLDRTTMYISNDIHYGALMWSEETDDRDWDLNIATKTHKAAIDDLVSRTSPTKDCIVVDLGDLTETDDYTNQTKRSGHNLSVDGRYPKILRAAWQGLAYTIQRALEKHETVYFYNIAGNHDETNGVAVREIIAALFLENPRVIVCGSPNKIKYHRFGKNLFQFAHGDLMRMGSAGEKMAYDRKDFSECIHRYSHFGHNHKDKAMGLTEDYPLCKAQSHRNLPPANDWAASSGMARGLGTMKAIEYHREYGEHNYHIHCVR